MAIMDKQQLNNILKKPELLAPAGDLARAKTAIRYGADAVYLGGQNFSLRSRASNFSMNDIKEACAYAKEHHASIHVTVNMIPHNEDQEGLVEYLKQLEEAGVKAIIVASPSIMKLAKECAPKLEVHCSTQMSITNTKAAEFLIRHLHIDRVVLARECTIEQVEDITQKCPVETEAFIHGGMCVNYSGRCTLSNRMTLRDANRGGCAQSCRWQYRLYKGKDKLMDDFTIGSKDLCAPEYIYALMKAGVSSFKIEGRMKTEYYVASVVSAYRHLIDEIYETQTELSKERFAYHKEEILKGGNRENWTGFYSGERGKDSLILHTYSNDTVNHDYLGIVEKQENGCLYFKSRNVFKKGDQIEVLTPGKENRVFEVTMIQDEDGTLLEESRRPMVLVHVPVPFDVEKTDILRKVRV